MKFFQTLALLLWTIVAVQAQTLWQGTVNSNWNNPANWSAGVPGPGGTATILASAPNQPVYGGATVINLTIENLGSLTFNSTVYNTGTITNFASATIINNGVFVNAGAIFFNNDGNLDNNGTFENYGTYDHAASAVLNNATGSIFKSFGIFNSNGQINNDGQLTIIGTFSNTNGMLNNGTFTISGTASFPAASSMSNPSGATINITATGSLDFNGTLTNGGSISNSGKLVVQNAATLTNGGTITSNNQMSIAGDFINNATLTNSGTLKINSAGVLENNATVTNSGNISLEICGKLIQKAGNNIGGNIANDGLVYEITGTVNETNGDFGDTFTNINDTPDPVPACKGDLILELNQNGVVNFTGADVDRGRSYGSCGATLVSFSVTPNQFTTVDIGVKVVTLTITDNFGKTASCQDFVNVVPFQTPITPVNDPDITFSCPANITKNTQPGAKFAPVSWTAPTATTTCNPSSGGSVSSLQIVARGDAGMEEMELWVKCKKVYTWQVNTTFTNYIYNSGLALTAADIQIKFINDFNDLATGVDRNLVVDKIILNSVTHQAEAATVLQYGAETVGCSNLGYHQKQKLVCNGFFQFGDGPVPCASLPNTIIDMLYMGEYNGSKYYCSNSNKTWAQAKTLADNMGGHMVTINNAGENAFIKAGIIAETAWIGINDVTTEGSFTWQSGENPGYINWDTGEPNNYLNSDGVVMIKSSGKWRDRAVAEAYEAVVEIPCCNNTTTCNAPATIAGMTLIGEYNNSKYFISNASANWTTANAAAIAANGFLADITTAGENTFIKNAFTSGSVWIGLNKVAAPNVFNWTSGQPLVYSNWQSGEPNESSTAVATRLTQSSGQWTDRLKTDSYRYIVEVPCDNSAPQGGGNPQLTVTQIGGPQNNSNFGLGTTTVAYKVTDACGNLEICTFTVTVIEVPATFALGSCPDDLTVNTLPGATSAVATWTDPSGISDCFRGGPIGVDQTLGPDKDSNFPIGTSTVGYAVFDSCGNFASCFFDVTVNQVLSTLTISGCPANFNVVAADGASSAIVSWTAPTATTNCFKNSNTTVTQLSGPASGSAFPLGSTQVIYLFADDCSNTQICSFTVLVNTACTNSGGDADDDGVCANIDCDDNNADIPATPGSACNDGDANTANDVYGADGCTCAGTIINPCLNNGGDADADGICADDDCDDNNEAVPTAPGTTCNDNNPLTLNDVIQNDGCTCAGALPVTLSVADVSVAESAGSVDVDICLNAVSNVNVQFSYLTTSGTALAVADFGFGIGNPIIQAGQLCTTIAVIIVDDTEEEGNETFTIDISSPINATIADASGTVTILVNDGANPCAANGGDADGDGICANADCDDNNANLPATPGTACNDNNANTTNDVIGANGCTCSGTVVNPCAANGGDVDGDGICANADCDDNNANLPATPGTACNDNNANTTNDVIGANGCTCSGTVVNPCAANGGDVDGDGICANADCDDNNANLPATPGTACNDNNANTTNDVIGANGCTCAGTSVTPACNPTYTISGNTLTVSGLTGAHNAINIYKLPAWSNQYSCFDNCSNTITLPNGSYYLHIKILKANYTIECQLQEYITITGGGPACTPGAACNDNNACTNNDVYDANCNCAGVSTDADGDGVCANQDCNDNNANLPATPGTACNDNNANTTNDVIGADGCTCVGTPVAGPCNPTYTISGNTLTVSGLTGAHNSINIYKLPAWSNQYSCFDNCTSTITLPNGSYYLHIKILRANYTIECQLTEYITITGGGPACTPGAACNDNNACTNNDVYNANCICAGVSTDADGDGVCANQDCNDNNANVPATPGTACDDGQATTQNDVIGADGCTCAGTPIFPCTNSGGDADGDGVCGNTDCDDTDPTLPATVGSACNDNNAATISDVIQADGCTCAGVAPDACAITVSTGPGSITINGLNGANVIVHVFNSSWTSVFSCLNNCTNPQVISNLPVGTYYVKATNYNASWAILCSEIDYYTITQGGSPLEATEDEQYLFFTANKNATSVKLDWVSNADERTAYYQIERSADGENFSTIGEVNSKTESSEAVNYADWDHAPMNGLNFYRITQIFQDGTVRKSTVEVLSFDKSLGAVLIYPNPAATQVSVAFPDFIGEAADIQIYNQLGQLMEARAVAALAEQAQVFDLQQYTSGVYAVTILTGGGKRVTKLFVVGKE